MGKAAFSRRAAGVLHAAGAVFAIASVAVAQSDEPPSNLRLEIGAEERVRWENWDNVLDFSDATRDARHQLRFRTRLWGTLYAGSGLEAKLGLNNESRKIFTPDSSFHGDETLIETLYLDYRFSDRLSARVGRQDLRYGEGLVVFDGTPGDGSRTMYVNALRLTWSHGPSRLDALAISDQARDQYLPLANDQHRPVVEWDERALGLYYTYRPKPSLSREGYFFLKSETEDPKLPNRTVYTLGSRLVAELDPGWSLAGELAGQFTSWDLDPREEFLAVGGTASVKKTFVGLPAKPALTGGLVALSGGVHGVGVTSRWDPLFARWPKWSELYIYSLAKENGPAYWTNILLWQAEAQATPLAWLKARATYYRMGAFNPVTTGEDIFPVTRLPFAPGLRRGDLWQLRADAQVSDTWRAHVLGEYLEPGSFYAGNDAAWFLRLEASYAWKRVLGL